MPNDSGTESGNRNNGLEPPRIAVVFAQRINPRDTAVERSVLLSGRTKVPPKIASKVIYASLRTCCVCAEMGAGKAIQIHHIDGNPNNHEFRNLAVLCLACHNETLLNGGFDRKLTPELVIEHRDNWLKRVRKRRKKSDEMAVLMQAGGNRRKQINPGSDGVPEPSKFVMPLLALINTLPHLKATVSVQVQPKRDTGVTSTMVEASNDYIDSIVAILIALSGYYAENPFGDQSPEEHFSEIISSRFRWHRSIAEPEGFGTGGTIVRILVARSVEADIDKMVEDMVGALVGWDDSFDFCSWRRCWRDDKTEY